MKKTGSRTIFSGLGVLVCLALPTAGIAQGSSVKLGPIVATPITDNPADGENQLANALERRTRKKALFPTEPLGFFRNGFGSVSDRVYDKTGLRLTLGVHNAWQWYDNQQSGFPDKGSAMDIDFNGRWELVNRGEPNEGGIFFNVDGRWNWTDFGPQTLGFSGIGAAGGTANTFAEYAPALILRQIYWWQGSEEAGWSLRIGKATVDALFMASRHLNPNTTFLSNVGTSPNADASPDSGLAIIGNYAFNENWSILARISDANADRYDFGSPGAGDYHKGAELQWRSNKNAARATIVKVSGWHTDGTKDGEPDNVNTGSDGYGFTAFFEHELADDGRPVVIGRYGKSYDGASIWDQQVGLSFLLYQPLGPLRFETDVFGAAINSVDSATPGTPRETNYEIFYRFPLFPNVDLTLNYQYIDNPANNTEHNNASAFALRLVTTF
ncbi:MAG: hypothetical protein N838_29245 [Thiohalocapsa sp. PB-PSB1]|jgi:hypothetical protein|nr:MAG: hypothetical protein N838_26705 [Thiohalocapsa sp. PB-PSB1]QQO56842.1 MAG: hypothetical protein N838_29245 [Thiohalocapsa sp. PB-PSB1]